MIVNATIIDIRPSCGSPACHMHFGTLVFHGTNHHTCFIRVKEGDMVEPMDEAPEEVKERFEDMQSFYEGAYHTLEIPGLPGRYVMFVYPFAE